METLFTGISPILNEHEKLKIIEKHPLGTVIPVVSSNSS